GQEARELRCTAEHMKKKAQPVGIALKFHQRRRIWRSVSRLWESFDTSPLCIPGRGVATLLCCSAVEIFCDFGELFLIRSAHCENGVQLTHHQYRHLGVREHLAR